MSQGGKNPPNLLGHVLWFHRFWFPDSHGCPPLFALGTLPPGGTLLTQRRITINLDLNLIAIALVMLLCHGGLILVLNPHLTEQGLDQLREMEQRKDAIKIDFPTRPMARTLGRKDGSKKNNVLVTPKNAVKSNQSKPLDPFKAAAAMNQPFKPQRAAQAAQQQNAKPTQPNTRPGTAASARISQTALDRLTQSSRPVQEVAKSNIQVAGQAASIPSSPILSKSNINMQVEVPEGVAADELNEYELMFYGFQKRMMEKYLGSIMLQVREYERKYPHKAIIPDGRHIMTGRVTFDSDGNIKQIKMVRWSSAENLQGLFEDVLKSMDSVPNPPKQLWNKEGDFVVFYNLTVNNG